MTIVEYAEKAKKEIDDMVLMYVKENKKDPNNWPLDLPVGEWGEQELNIRFK